MWRFFAEFCADDHVDDPRRCAAEPAL